MTPIAPSTGPRPDARPPDMRDTVERAGAPEADRTGVLRSILISLVGTIAVMAMILTLTGSNPGLAR